MTLLLLSLALATEGPDAGGVALADLMTGLPRCDARPEADPQLDLFGACVDGLCVGDPLAAFEAVYGPADCSLNALGEADICRFGTHLTLHLQPGRDAARAIFLLPDHPARTADGLGIGSPLTCFVDRFAEDAVAVDVKVSDGRLTWEHLQLRRPRAIVTVDEEGRARKIQLGGPSRPR